MNRHERRKQEKQGGNCCHKNITITKTEKIWHGTQELSQAKCHDCGKYLVLMKK